MAHRSWKVGHRPIKARNPRGSVADAAQPFSGYIRAINARQDKTVRKIRQSSLKRTEPLQDLCVVKPADGSIAGVGESPRADVMRLPRHLLRTADRGLGTQALNCIVGKDGAVITPRYRRCKVVDHAFAHSSLSLIAANGKKPSPGEKIGDGLSRGHDTQPVTNMAMFPE